MAFVPEPRKKMVRNTAIIMAGVTAASIGIGILVGRKVAQTHEPIVATLAGIGTAAILDVGTNFAWMEISDSRHKTSY